MTDEVYLAVVRRRIKLARLARSLRQEDVAERLGISLRAYQRYEGEDTSREFNPYVLTMRRIARTLGEDPGAILGEPTQSEIGELEGGAKTPRAPKRAVDK
ncbi:MAG TPA: helix-turn-helix transcriptional regulator [Trueperaceae bacterium]